MCGGGEGPVADSVGGDMERFGFGRHSSDPWFRVGTVDVTTTVLIVAMGVFSMFVWAAEGRMGPIFRNLWMISDQVLGGDIWRLITWPIPNEPGLWTIILFVIFFMFGSQLEAHLGKRDFLTLILAITLVPAIVITLTLDLILNVNGGVAGLRTLELGILVAFIAQWPRSMFWPGIPAPVLGGLILVIETLQLVGLRDWYHLWFLWVTVAVALLVMRGLGYADELQAVPALPLRQVMGQGGAGRGTKRSRRRGRANLAAVPTPKTTHGEVLADREIDALLDQVADQGLDSLTPEQRSQLEAHSKRLRDRGND